MYVGIVGLPKRQVICIRQTYQFLPLYSLIFCKSWIMISYSVFMYNLYSLLFNIHMKVQSTIKSTQYIRKYINVLLDVLCTFFPFPLDKYLFLRVNVPLGVLCTFKSESTKYIRRYKVHPKVQSTPHMYVSIYFWELGLNKKGKFIQSIVTCWKPLFWPHPKFHVEGRVHHQCPQNHYCLHIFLYEC